MTETENDGGNKSRRGSKLQIPAIVLERVGSHKDFEGADSAELQKIIQELYDRWVATENDVYDINHDVKVKEMQIHDLEMEVSDMRGKFIIPKLKKVHNFKLMGNEE